jgi:hypothetical protein
VCFIKYLIKGNKMSVSLSKFVGDVSKYDEAQALAQALKAPAEESQKGEKRKRTEGDEIAEAVVAKKLKASDETGSCASAIPEKSASLPQKVKTKCSCGMEDSAPSLSRGKVDKYVPIINGKAAYETPLEKAFESLALSATLQVLNTDYGSTIVITKERFLTHLLPFVKAES